MTLVKVRKSTHGQNRCVGSSLRSECLGCGRSLCRGWELAPDELEGPRHIDDHTSSSEVKD